MLAILLVIAAGLSAAWQNPAQPGSAVIALVRDLALGADLAPEDVALVRMLDPPDGALTSVSQAVGQRLSAAARRGEVLTDLRLVNPDGPDPGPGRAAIAVRPADPALAELLQPGMSVTVIGVGADGAAQTLSSDALVLAVLDDPSDRSSAGRPVLLSVPLSQADRLTAGTLSGDIALRFT